MNELEFKRHLKDLAHGHHHPEEHDWAETPAPTSKKGRTASKPAVARKRSQKPSKKK